MEAIKLFTDGSVDVKSGIGYGAFIALSEAGNIPDGFSSEVKVKRFENTSSTRLELETLLWALKELGELKCKIVLYTDSRNITGLHERRLRLEQKDYFSKNNRLIRNHDLYREFFKVFDLLNFELVKVKGHQPTRQKGEIHRLFTLVDRASRNALRKEFSSL